MTHEGPLEEWMKKLSEESLKDNTRIVLEAFLAQLFHPFLQRSFMCHSYYPSLYK